MSADEERMDVDEQPKKDEGGPSDAPAGAKSKAKSGEEGLRAPRLCLPGCLFTTTVHRASLLLQQLAPPIA